MDPRQAEQIACVCHEANRAYCATIGDSVSTPWTDATAWQEASAIKGVYFHLEHLERGEKPSPSASHDAWLAQKITEGWKYGQVKDVAKKEHPCMLPYKELPVEQRLKDYIFAAIVEAFYKADVEDKAAATA